MLNAFYRRSPQVPAKVRMLLKYLNEQYGGEPPWERRLFRGRAAPAPHRPWRDRNAVIQHTSNSKREHLQ